MDAVNERRYAKLLVQLAEQAKRDQRERVDQCVQRWIENTPKEK
jgi:hypothetical protein